MTINGNKWGGGGVAGRLAGAPTVPRIASEDGGFIS